MTCRHLRIWFRKDSSTEYGNLSPSYISLLSLTVFSGGCAANFVSLSPTYPARYNHTITEMGPDSFKSFAVAFGFASSASVSLVRQPRMTAGNVSNTDDSTSPIRHVKPVPPPVVAKKIENRPELVGGLPLWLTVGAMTQLRRFAEVINFQPFAALRRRNVESAEATVVKEPSRGTRDLPVGRALRRIADAMEEELASMRLSLATLRAELSHSHAEANTLRKQLEFLKLRNAKDDKGDSEKALSLTVSQLRLLVCKEQTRAAAAEKKLVDTEKKLKAAEMRGSLLAGDSVKLSVLYTSLFAVFIGFLADSPFGPQIIQYLVSGGH